MTDHVPDVLEFESLKIHESNKTENVLKLEDPPMTECDQTSNVETHILIDQPIYNKNEFSEHDELLNLHEPPIEEENKEVLDNSTKLTDEAISEFVQNLIDPIVKEAIEIQKAEMEDSISDEVKVDSCGDKKSEKSLSDDGFEYLKADDINPSTGADHNNEELNQVLDSDCFSKPIEDDLFLHEDMKLEDSTFSTIIETQDNTNVTNDLIVEGEVVECSFPPGKIEFESPDEEVNDEAYDFGLQDIIKEGEASLLESERLEQVHESLILKYKPSELKSEPINSEFESLDETMVTTEKVTEKNKMEKLKTNKSETLKEPKNETTENSMNNTSENDICQKCKNVFCWKDPILSSIVLSIIMLMELGLMCDYSVISLLAYSGLLLLFSSFFYKFAVKFNLLRKCGQSNCSISVSSDDVQLCVDCVLKWIEYLFNEIRSLMYAVSFTKNLKAFTFFYILTYVGQWFNLLSLIFIGTIILFSLPITYTTYKETIDQIMDKIRGQIKDSINNLKLKFQQLLGR